ncbi:MAG TPA: hypothetical protein VFH45_04970 [Acidimicrobiales bacterium]|nr:hypothetical protein [Acidimicrobiales bacterium]
MRTSPLDRRVVRQSVLVIVAVGVPPAVLVRITKWSDLPGRESNWWIICLGILVVAFALGGWLAARRSPDLPLSHAAVAGATASILIGVGSALAAVALGAHPNHAYVLLLILLALICISASVIGGYAAARRAGF